MSAATIAALVLAGAAPALSALVALVSVGTIAYLFSTASYSDAWSEVEDLPVFTEGAVEDGDGLAVDGVGTYDRPARPGEHTLSRPTVGGGVLDVTVTAVDREADAAAAPARSDSVGPPARRRVRTSPEGARPPRGGRSHEPATSAVRPRGSAA